MRSRTPALTSMSPCRGMNLELLVMGGHQAERRLGDHRCSGSVESKMALALAGSYDAHDTQDVHDAP